MAFSSVLASVVMLNFLSTARSQSPAAVPITWETRFQALQFQLNGQIMMNTQRLINLDQLVNTKLGTGKAATPSGSVNVDVEKQLSEMKKSISEFEDRIDTIAKRLEKGISTEKVFRKRQGETCEATQETLNALIAQYKEDKASDTRELNVKLLEAVGKLNNTFTEFRSDIQAQIKNMETAQTKPVTGCQSEWFQVEDSCFLFVEDTQRPWYLAAMECQKRGGNLAEPKTAAINDELINRVGNSLVWLGGTDEETEGVWKWSSTNEPITYTDWGPGQPNSSGGDQDCLEIWKKKWNDLSCSNERKFLCEKKIEK